MIGAHFIERKKGKAIAKSSDERIAYDAASFKPDVFFLNPFFAHHSIQIPVPGQIGLTSTSLESIWQGLKLVNGETDFDMFTSKPRKRPNTKERRELTAQNMYSYPDSRFQYGTEELDLVTARKVIYTPSYKFLFDNYVPLEFKEQVKSQIQEGRDVYFYDWDDNPDIDNPNESFAHASLLVDLFNEYANTETITFSVEDLVKANTLQLDLPVKRKTSNYAGRLEIYIEQEIRRHSEIRDTSTICMGTDGEKTHRLSGDDNITITYKDGTMTVSHRAHSPIVSNLKNLKWFFSDIASRDFQATDIGTDFKLPEPYPKFQSHDYDTDDCANLSFRRLEDGSYIFTIKDNWQNNHREKVFMEKGTLYA